MTSVQWAPLVLSPIVLAAWIVLFAVLVDPRLGRKTVLRLPGGGRLWRIWWRAKRYARRGRDRRRHLARSRIFDAEQNAQTTPPEHVLIRWGGMWTVEIYTPAHMPRLIEGLHALGWDTNRRFGGVDLVTWLSNMRTGTGGWASAGPFRARGGAAFHLEELDITRRCALMIPTFHQLAPGLVALIVGWVLTHEEQASLEAAVREPAESSARSLKGGGSSVTPAEVNKAARVGKLRSELRGEATRWIRNSLPGLFAQELTIEQLPSWDLLLTEGANLKHSEPGHDWRGVVGYAHADEWRSPHTLGLSLLVPRFGNEHSASVPALFAERTSIVDDGHNGPSETLEDYPWWLIQRIDEAVGSLLGWWAVERALNGIDRALAEAREDLIGTGWRARSVRRRLDDMRTRVLPATLHVSALARGAEILQDPNSYARRSLPHFEGVERRVAGARIQPRALEETLVERVGEVSGRLADDARSTAEGWRGFTDVLLARTNLRLQNTILVVTAMAMAASVAAVVIALNN